MILLKVNEVATYTIQNSKLSALNEFANKYQGAIPIILTDEGEVIREAHSFLYEKHIHSRNMNSDKTVHTYAECLVVWLKYCALNSLDWKASTIRSLLHYRNSMKSGSGVRARSLRPKTINLRISVVIEFFKYFLEVEMTNNKNSERNYHLLLKNITNTRFNVRSSDSRPIALTATACRSLCASLKGVHRIIFIWGISTGLRISSILKVLLSDFEPLQTQDRGAFLEVLCKGGKIQKVFLPRYLIVETNRYLEVERKLVVLRAQKKYKTSLSGELFLNGSASSVTRGCYYAAFQRACTSQAIKSHPHQARTTFATFMERALRAYGKENNIDHVKIIQGLLGHADAITTMSYLESIAINNVDILGLLEANSVNVGGGYE